MSFSKIHQASNDTLDSCLDLFQVPNTKTSILSGSNVEIGPTRTPDGSQLEFHIKMNGHTYPDGSETVLRLAIRVLKSDGNILSNNLDNVKVMFCQNAFGSVIKYLKCSYGGHEVHFEAHHAYVSYLETLLNDSVGYKKTLGGCLGWVEDDTGPVDRASITAEMKGDIDARKKLIAGRLRIPFLTQGRYISPNSSMIVQVMVNDPEFCLIKTEDDAAAKYKIEVTECSLQLHQVDVHPSITTTQQQLLSEGYKFKYPLNKVDTQMFSISRGKQSERINIIIDQQKPKRLFFALMNHQAKNGSYDLDPFNFSNQGVNYICLEVDGRLEPKKPIQIDYDTDKFSIPFRNLARVTGKAFGGDGNGITLDRFKTNTVIYAFDLTPDTCEGGGVHFINNCSITLENPLQSSFRRHRQSVYVRRTRRSPRN